MRYFHSRVSSYKLVEQIYLLVGERPFTFTELVQAGIDIVPGHLSGLRLRGAVSHPKDTTRTMPPGLISPRRVENNKYGAKYWILTPEAVEVVQNELSKSSQEVTAK